MIKERYVNLEVAKLLRDKGFNKDYPKGDCTQYGCTQQMACDWVEETFNINIVVYLTINGYLVCFCHAHKNLDIASYGIPDDDMPCGDNSDGSWSSKELAYNNAIKYVLTNLI